VSTSLTLNKTKKTLKQIPSFTKKRQSIIEHNYGILKRQWGFYYINTKKGINRASADVGLMFCAYNLRRIINLVDKNLLKKFLKELWLSLLDKIVLLNGTARPFFGVIIFYSIFFHSNNESKNKLLLTP
jgi:hypothetical protein